MEDPWNIPEHPDSGQTPPQDPSHDDPRGDAGDDPWPIFYACPTCHREFEAVAEDHAKLTECPECHAPLIVASNDGSTELAQSDTPESHDDSDELDGLHIRHYAHERRVIFRMQSRFTVLTIGCMVGAIQLLIFANRSRRMHQSVLWMLAFVATASGLLWLGWGFFHRARHYRQLARKSALGEPDAKPDFTPLRDGSQFVDELDKLK